MAAISGMVTAGLGIAQGVMGYNQAKDAADAADAQMARQSQLQGRQLEIGQEQMAFFRDQYNQWRQEFAPVLDQMKTMAMEGVEPDYAAIAADTARAFDSQEGATTRQMQRYGVDPGDGAFGSTIARSNLAQAGAEVDARQNARRNAEDRSFGRLGSLYGIGAGLQGQALSGLSGATGALMGTLGNQAQTAGVNADRYGQAAAAGAQAFGNTDWGGIIGGAVDSVFGPQAPTAGGMPAGNSYGVLNTPSGRAEGNASSWNNWGAGPSGWGGG